MIFCSAVNVSIPVVKFSFSAVKTVLISAVSLNIPLCFIPTNLFKFLNTVQFKLVAVELDYRISEEIISKTPELRKSKK